MMDTRTETDTLGEVQVPVTALWGAQTQRSINNFPIGDQRMPPVMVRAMVTVKKAAAHSNRLLGSLDGERERWIVAACDQILAGKHDDQFPVVVWQTGSGTQSNMNCNEVIANLASEIGGGRRGEKRPVHPNDHVNLSQSSNDFFPTAMHVAAVMALEEQLFPALKELHETLAERATALGDAVKIGRTHMMDATPLTLGQELGGYVAQLDFARARLAEARETLLPLALGGTAVGTGLNSLASWGETVARQIATLTGLPFTSATDKFMALSAHDAMLGASSALRQLASAYMVIGNNIRLLASGPRCGIGELSLPANEPGSSIMPGKVNPTQCEALTMVAAQVIGNDTAVANAASQGHLQLNVFKPVILHNVLQSTALLADATRSFARRCIAGLEANPTRIAAHLENSLMLVTALSPALGYDRAAAVAKRAFEEGRTLREIVLEEKLLDEKEFERLVDPQTMLAPDTE